MEYHPLADLFPPMDEATFENLKESIRADGLKDEISTLKGKVLDGRHRLRACLEVGVEPRFQEYTGSDPLAFVLSLNDKARRHLTESQRAMVAAKIANLNVGRPRSILPTGNSGETDPDTPLITQSDAAAMQNVSKRSVGRARRILEEGVPELIGAVETGAMTIRAAEQALDQPPERQQAEAKKAVQEMAEFAESNGKTEKVRRKPKSRLAAAKRGKHKVSEEESQDAVLAVEALLERWDSMTGFQAMVSHWDRSKRWKFCDKLESLARIMKGLAEKLRHHGPTT